MLEWLPEFAHLTVEILVKESENTDSEEFTLPSSAAPSQEEVSDESEDEENEDVRLVLKIKVNVEEQLND